MIPCLYASTEMKFNHNGIGKLADAQSCTVTEKRNGSYELKLVCPADGIHAEMLEEGNIILAKPSDTMQSQPLLPFLPAELHHSFPVLSDWVCGSNAGAEKPRCF